MATNEGVKIKSSYKDLLKISNGNAGMAATAIAVETGEGTTCALGLAQGFITVDNIKIDGNTISSTDTNGNINLTPNGSGAVVITGASFTSPTFTNATMITPILGTPQSGTLTNCTGLPVSTGISGLGTGVATFLGTPSSANLLAALTDETGTGAAVFATSPTLVTPILGTPTSGTLTNCTGLPVATGISGLGTGVATALAASPTGSGSVTLATAPSITKPALVASSGIIMTGFAIPPQGRLTLQTATPVPASDQVNKTTVYYTPYVGTRLALYTSSVWSIYNFTELSIAVPATTNTNYDVFVYDNSGTLTLEAVAWTDATTRATALVYQDGMLVKSGSTNKLFLGSFRTTGVSGQTQDARNGAFVSNYYNRVSKHVNVVDSTNSWTYSSNTIRQANGSSTNKLQFLLCSGEDDVQATVLATVQGSTTAVASWVGVGLDSATVNSAPITHSAYSKTNAIGTDCISAIYHGQPGAGFHELYWLESNRTNSGTMTVFGDNNDSGGLQSGIVGVIKY